MTVILTPSAIVALVLRSVFQQRSHNLDYERNLGTLKAFVDEIERTNRFQDIWKNLNDGIEKENENYVNSPWNTKKLPEADVMKQYSSELNELKKVKSLVKERYPKRFTQSKPTTLRDIIDEDISDIIDAEIVQDTRLPIRIKND